MGAVAHHGGYYGSDWFWQFDTILADDWWIEVILYSQFLQCPPFARLFGGVAAYGEQFVEVNHIGLALKDFPAPDQFQVDGCSCEHVYLLIVLEPNGHFQRSIPPCDHIAGVGVVDHLFGKAEINEFNIERVRIYHHVLRLHVPVHDLKGVQVR